VRDGCAVAIQSSPDTTDTNFTSLCKIVFPNPDDPPAALPQRSIHETIPQLIHRQFPFPERRIALRNVRMLWAKMPKTAVNENDQSSFPKDEIRFAKNLLIAAPTGEEMTPEQMRQGKLRVLIPAAAYSHVAELTQVVDFHDNSG
jgi:hypothetical protein